MKFRHFSILLITLFIWTALASQSWCGQVVTEETRLWARKALQEEKGIETVKGKNTLAVLYFQNKTGRPDLDPVRKGLTLMLITDLSTLEGLQIVERTKLQALTEEMGLGTSGLVEPGTEPRVGKMLGAEWLMGGDIMGGDPVELRVQSDLLDVPAAQSIGQQTVEGGLEDLFRLEKDILFDIIKTLKIKLTPQQQAALKKPCSTSAKALMAFFKGINASDQGDYEGAAEQYEKALKNDPGICEAEPALKELQVLGLVTVKTRSGELLRSMKDRTSLTDQLGTEDSMKREPGPETTPSPVSIDLQF
ncbi:MAG: CsgG/HfaB family protein [Nitrospirota bacterium]